MPKLLRPGDLVSGDLIANPIYRDHTGRVLRVMTVMEGPGQDTQVAEVVWDSDPPVPGLSRQVIPVHHLFRLGHEGDYVLQE